MAGEYTHITHPFPPVYDERSRVLILGSFPSVRSREVMFYYGHPQNRFWRMLGAVLGCDFPANVEGKRELLLKHRIALWDVIASCDIVGSDDSSVKNALPNDLPSLIRASSVERVITNGKLSYRLYCEHMAAKTDIPAISMPSTSPANAAWTLERLVETWRPAILFE